MEFSRKKCRVPAWIIGVGLTASSIFGFAHGAAAQELRKVTFAVPVTAVPVSTGAYSSLPKILGYWEEEGLDVDVITVGGSSLAMQMVISGQADFVGSGLPDYLATRGKTDDVSANYCVYSHNQYQIITLPDSPINTLEDMPGHSFAVINLASASVTYTKAALKSVGIDPESVELLPVSGSPAAMANTLKSGTVAGIAGYDAITGGVEVILDTKVKHITTPLDEALKCGLVVAGRADFMAENPDVAIGIARGIAKATAFADANMETAIKLHWQVYPDTKPSSAIVDPMKAALSELGARLGSMRVDRDKGEIWGDITPAQMATYQEFLLDAGTISEVLPFEQVFDNSMITEINDWDETALRKQAMEMKVD